MTFRRGKAERIRLIDDSAFAIKRVKVHSPKPEAWHRSDTHLGYVAGLRCIGCGREPPEKATPDNPRNQAAHVSKGSDHATRKKASDYFTVSLCGRCHAVQHQIGEPAFYDRIGVIDPILRALEIAMSSPCERTKAAAIEEWRRRYQEVG